MSGEVSSADRAAEVALDAMRKAGWHFVWATSVRLEDGLWHVLVETFARRFLVKVERSGRVVEIVEAK